LNALYLASVGKWVRVDARGNTGGIDAQFDVERERLAFPVDWEKGNLFVYETVFADPVAEWVEVLRRFADREAMWWHLPGMIGDEVLCEGDRERNRALRGRE
jgi:hypothetical protein